MPARKGTGASRKDLSLLGRHVITTDWYTKGRKRGTKESLGLQQYLHYSGQKALFFGVEGNLTLQENG